MGAFQSDAARSAFTLALVDGDGLVRYQSSAIQSLLGYRPEDIAGNAWFSFLHADDAGAVRNQFQELIHGGGQQARWVIRFRAASGGWQAVEVRARNLLEDPDVEGVLLSLRAMPA
jgi:PAS domain S-box-containing protein